MELVEECNGCEAEIIKLGLGNDGWIGADCWVWIVEVHVVYVLQEQCVLCPDFRPEIVLDFQLRLSALVSFLECNDGLVVALDGMDATTRTVLYSCRSHPRREPDLSADLFQETY
jgi:hypothetical protein